MIFNMKKKVLESAEIEYVAKEKVDVSQEDLDKAEKISNDLDDNEDVGDYYTNLN